MIPRGFRHGLPRGRAVRQGRPWALSQKRGRPKIWRLTCSCSCGLLSAHEETQASYLSGVPLGLEKTGEGATQMS